MGRDIHAFVEFDLGESTPFEKQGNVRAFNSGEFFVSPNDELFQRLCGDAELGLNKGLPRNCSFTVLRRYCVSCDSRVNLSLLETPVPLVSETRFDELTNAPIVSDNGQTLLKPNPNWHSANWLGYDETQKVCSVIDRYSNPEFVVILGIMTNIEHFIGKARSRLVYWFDN